MMTPATNLTVPITTHLPPNDSGLQSLVVDKIRGLMDAAKSPVIIVDGGIMNNSTPIDSVETFTESN